MLMCLDNGFIQNGHEVIIQINGIYNLMTPQPISTHFGVKHAHTNTVMTTKIPWLLSLKAIAYFCQHNMCYCLVLLNK